MTTATAKAQKPDGDLDQAVPLILQARALRDPDGILIQDTEGRVISNGEFHRATLRFADVLSNLAVTPGDRVATFLDTSPQGHVVWIGICWAGALEVPINPDFRGNTLVYALNDSRARILITRNSLLEKIAAVSDELMFLQHIVTLDESVPDAPLRVSTLASLEAVSPAVAHRAPLITDPYAVIYTSGTTGPSKGVVVPWQSIQTSIEQLFSGDDITVYDDPAFYCPWPSFHSSGKVGLVFAAVKHCRLVMRRHLSISAYWDDIRRFRCTHTQLLGLAGLLMAREPEPADADNTLARVLMNPVIPEYRDFERRFGVTVSTGWGMTEIGFPMACSSPPNHTTCGTLSPLYQVRLVDDDDRDVPEGEVGQLVIRPLKDGLLLKEYLGKPEATAKAWRNGWFHTGDALRRDADGFYYFVDRVADYLRVRGNNVSSLEVESEVCAHPEVRECAAIGVAASLGDAPAQRVSLGEDEIKVVVRRRDQSRLTAAELMDFLIARMPRYMVPRYIEFIDEFPRTPTGKIRKKALRETPLTADTWDRVAAGVAVPR